MLLCFACVVACVVDWWGVFVVGGSFFLFFFLFLLFFCSPIFVNRVFSEELLGLMLGLLLFMPIRAAGAYVEAYVFWGRFLLGLLGLLLDLSGLVLKLLGLLLGLVLLLS